MLSRTLSSILVYLSCYFGQVLLDLADLVETFQVLVLDANFLDGLLGVQLQRRLCWLTKYIGLGFVVAKLLQVVPHLVDGCDDVPLRVVGAAQHKVKNALGVLLAVPDAIARRYLLALLGPQVEALELAEDLAVKGVVHWWIRYEASLSFVSWGSRRRWAPRTTILRRRSTLCLTSYYLYLYYKRVDGTETGDYQFTIK